MNRALPYLAVIVICGIALFFASAVMNGKLGQVKSASGGIQYESRFN